VRRKTALKISAEINFETRRKQLVAYRAFEQHYERNDHHLYSDKLDSGKNKDRQLQQKLKVEENYIEQLDENIMYNITTNCYKRLKINYSVQNRSLTFSSA